jgi:hypothetical protein
MNWIDDVLPKINAARNHIEERIHAEDDLVAEADRKIGDIDQKGRERLVFVKEQLETAARKHNELLTVVMGANKVFLDEHAQQSFRRSALTPFPNPQTAVLKPLLRQTAGTIDEWVSKNWELLHPPSIAPRPDLAQIVAKLWQERRMTELSVPVLEPELESIDEDTVVFSAETKARVEETMSSLPSVCRLSEWLNCFDPGEFEARHLTLLLAGQWFEGAEDGLAIRSDDQHFEVADAYGHDLIIERTAHV